MVKSCKDGLGQDALLYPVSKVAEMFSISNKSVYRLIDRGLLQSSSALRHKRVTRASIEKFLATTTQTGGVR